MRRTTRKALTNLSLFVLALLLILYLNGDHATHKTFDWITIRYKITSATLPEARGRCPGLAETSKPALIVSRVTADGDASWVDRLQEKYHPCVYNVDALTDKHSMSLQVPANRGHESMAYLTYLIDNYDHLPTASVFVHGSRWAWHNDHPEYDNFPLLAALNVSSALAPAGYHNLRCDWASSTCPISAAPQGSLETSMNARLEPWNMRLVSDAALPPAFVYLFGGNAEGGPSIEQRVSLGRHDAVRSQCCAQFVVARQNIMQHSREEYVALRQWLLDDGTGSAPKDDRTAGRIISYLWHILFLPKQDYTPRASPGAYGGVDLDRLNAMACPSAADCYCRLYGRCNLSGCVNQETCLGQYVVPPDYKLPHDWAATHGGPLEAEGIEAEHGSLKRRTID